MELVDSVHLQSKQPFKTRSGHLASFLALFLICQPALFAQTLPSAVSQQAVIDAQAQQDRERQRKVALQEKPDDKTPVEATAVSEDLGSLQLVREIPDLPFARLHMDQSYSWLSNANYAKNSQNVVAAWQAISSIEGAWAPTIQTMPGYDKFFPEVGVRASFFNYFSQEEPSQTNNNAGTSAWLKIFCSRISFSEPTSKSQMN